MNWLVIRMREPSTWRGLVWLLTALGVSLRPEIWEQVTAVGMAVAGLLGILMAESAAPAPESCHDSQGDQDQTPLPPIEMVGRSESGPRRVSPNHTGDAAVLVGRSTDPAVDRLPSALLSGYRSNTKEAADRAAGWGDQDSR